MSQIRQDLSISVSMVPRQLDYQQCPSNTQLLPQYAPELFSLSETASTIGPDFFTTAAWHRTLDTMARTACKEGIFKHLLTVEQRTLIERMPYHRQYHQGDLSSESTTDSLTSIETYKHVDHHQTSSNAILLADRSRLLLNQHADSNEGFVAGGITKSTRSSVVFWMKKVVENMKWPVSVFFTAVHAMDYTLPSEVRMAGRCEAESVIPLLSVACVLVGVSSECEHKHLSKTRCFVGQVPNVSSVKEVICKELSVVARLSKGSLLHKTPVDFLLYFIARLRAFDAQVSAAEGSFSSLYKIMCNSQIILTSSGRHISEITHRETSSLLDSLIGTTLDDTGIVIETERILSTLMELGLALSLTLFSNALHRVVPASRLIALVMMHVMSLFCPGMRDARVCADISRILFCLDYTSEVAPLWPCIFNVYELCLRGLEGDHCNLYKCSSSNLLVLEILAEGRSQHWLPHVTKLHPQ